MEKEKRIKNVEYGEHYIGLDIGTDSVGYAVTDDRYSLRKFKGEPMWGVTTFEAANTAEDRRGNRTNRRRLDRRQWRVALVSELFAKEIEKVDDRFFVRLRASGLKREDTDGDDYIFFQDVDFTDADYNKKFPTIHHLIAELMESDEPHDVRLVYLACAWLVAHRGHFLSDVSIENVREISDFSIAYKKFESFFLNNGLDLPWHAETEVIRHILTMKTGVSAKEKAFATAVFGGKIPKDKVEDVPEDVIGLRPYNRSALVKLLCGGTVAPKEIFLVNSDAYSEMSSFSLGKGEEEFNAILEELGDDGEVVRALRVLYDTASLIDILKNETRISVAKKAVYEQHASDLLGLKKFVRTYLPQKYYEIFRKSQDKFPNYVSYSYKTPKKLKKDETLPHGKATAEDFCKYLKKLLGGLVPEEKDQAFFADMMARIERNAFMPKQVSGDNRVIPYQLYFIELKDILARAQKYLPFLAEKDVEGYTVAEKIESIFSFRLPYFVGPMHEGENSRAWSKKKSGRFLPWKAESMIDYDVSEQKFIQNLVGKCTYLPNELVLPKDSLLYCRFTVLNAINNLKYNGKPITVELKQEIYENLFMRYPKITKKKICDYCKNNGYISAGEEVEGVDDTVGASLRSYLDFKNLLNCGTLSERDVEDIIEHSVCIEDRYRFKKWLEKQYSSLSESDVRYIASRRYKDFGRLSRRLLTNFYGTPVDCKGTVDGEAFTVMDLLWSENVNLMQLLESEKYSFKADIAAERQAYYAEADMSLDERLDSMYISRAVRRPIIRTISILDDIDKAIGKAPKKVFVEMARGAKEDQKGRTKTRKQHLLDLYKQVKDADVPDLLKELELMGDEVDNRLQSEKLYLYFLQLGKCMYSGESINLEELIGKDGKRYDIDHIYPQSVVKDDSVLNNKVLVLSTYNKDKADVYPIKAEWQSRMAFTWKKLHDNGLMTDEKYRRLIRPTGFSEEERHGFINRQLVETTQATKAVTVLLKERYPETEIVFVKAGLVSDFRHEYGIVKSRIVNDLHHAKDAYLNIAVGDTYHEHFTKNFYIDRKYSMKTECVFACKASETGALFGTGATLVEKVKKIVAKEHVHVTRYAFCRKGGFFDQIPLRAAEGLVPRKKGLTTEKYGGYRKPAASFFLLVKYTAGKKHDVVILPIELMHEGAVNAGGEKRDTYVKAEILKIHNKVADTLEYPLGDRLLRVNTVFSLDGLRVCLAGKDSGGKCILFSCITPLICDADTLSYVKALERYSEKKKKNHAIRIDTKFSKINTEQNVKLYDFLLTKLTSWPFEKRPAKPIEVLIGGRERFCAGDLEEQVSCLINVLSLFSRGASAIDLSAIDGGSKVGCCRLGAAISGWKKQYADVRIIDSTPSGLWEKESDNLFDLL